jgi:hypothetical protein
MLMTEELLYEYIQLMLLSEKKRVTVDNMKRAYKSGKKGRGTKKSIRSMAREINKCADPENRPASCYEYWDADKEYDSAKGKKK